MNRLLTVIAMLALAACEQTVAPTSPARTSDLLPSFDASTNAAQTQTLQLSGVVTSPCTGEHIAYTGSAHVVTQIVDSTADGYTLRYHFNTQGISGVGLASGTKYQIVDAFNEEEGVISLPHSVDADVSEHYRVISENSLGNFDVNLIYTFTSPPAVRSYQMKVAKCEG